MKELLYINLARNIEQKIRNDVFKIGDKLPSIRTVCDEYGVSMNTAMHAYLELEGRSLIKSQPKSGFYVTHNTGKRLAFPETSKPLYRDDQEQADDLIGRVYGQLGDQNILRLSLGVPDEELLPIAKLNKGLVYAMRSLPASGTAYEEIQGNKKLCRDIARCAYTWGASLTQEDIVTTAGAMNAISYCMMALTKPGDKIAVESPVYFGILQLAKSLGLHVLELPTNAGTGIELDALKKVMPEIKLLLLVSNFNNPLGSCMPVEHKKEVVKLIEQYNIPLIEDDLYGDVYFGESRPKPCKAYDESGLVLWCGSVSKTLAPGYRVGWVAPGKYKDKIIRMKLLHTVSTTTLTQEVIANFLESGHYEKYLRSLRRTLHTNSLQFNRAISDYFPEETKASQPHGGFVMWVELAKNIDAAKLYNNAMKRGISIAPGRMFTLQNQFNNCMRLSYGMKWSKELEQKLKLLGELVKKSI